MISPGLALRQLRRDLASGDVRILLAALVLAVMAVTSVSFITDRAEPAESLTATAVWSAGFDDATHVLDRLPKRHFHLVDTMTTAWGREEAQRRTRILAAYYKAFLREAGFA